MRAVAIETVTQDRFRLMFIILVPTWSLNLRNFSGAGNKPFSMGDVTLSPVLKYSQISYLSFNLCAFVFVC